MADLKKKLSELLTDYADNNAGNITPQLLRNGFKTVVGSIAIKSVTTDYALLEDDIFVKVVPTTTSLNITLPALSTFTEKYYIIKNTGTNHDVIVIGLIDSVSNFTLTPGSTLAIISDGTNWVSYIQAQSSGNFVRISGDVMTGSLTTPKLITSAISFITSATPQASSPGLVQWNSEDKTLDIGLDGAVLQVGQESMVYAVNKTGVTIPDGSVVYLKGSQGQRIEIALADADSYYASQATIGIVTQDISNNGMGYVTTMGLVRNINTHGITEGSSVFLSQTPGQYTTTVPPKGVRAVHVGIVVKGNSVGAGSIYVLVKDTAFINEINDVDTTGATEGSVLMRDANGIYKPYNLQVTQGEYFYIHSALMGSATSTYGFFSLHPQNANPFDNALTTAYDSYNNGKLNPILMPFNWKLTEVHLTLGHCAVAQGTVGTNPTVRIEFFSHTGLTRTSIGYIDMTITSGNCGIYNNLGGNNFQNSVMTSINTISGNENDLIGWQFTNRGATNNEINSVAQVTLETKFIKV